MNKPEKLATTIAGVSGTLFLTTNVWTANGFEDGYAGGFDGGERFAVMFFAHTYPDRRSSDQGLQIISLS